MSAATGLLAPAPESSAPEMSIVTDMARRSLYAAPIFIVFGVIADGSNGAISAAIGVVLVVLNFFAAGASLTWAARISLAVLMTSVLFGYLLRLALLFGAVLALRGVDWVHVPSVALTIAFMHLGLLMWELKYVSLSLAHPGLKPDVRHQRSPQT